MEHRRRTGRPARLRLDGRRDQPPVHGSGRLRHATRGRRRSAERIRDAYLARWSDHLEPAALAEAGDLAIVVGTVYQVDTYIRLVESLDPDDLWDLAPAAGSWARAAVATLHQGIDLVRPGHADG